MNIVLLAAPVFILFLLIDLILDARRGGGRYDPDDTFVSLVLGLGYLVVGMLPFALGPPLLSMLVPYAISDVALSAGSLLFCILLVDFGAYWSHRLQHRWRFWWVDHVVHHNSSRFNFATALRMGWFYDVMLKWFYLAPAVLVGFDVETISLAIGMVLIYQFFQHSEQFGSWGFLEAVLCTPTHHRLHHASNPEYLDRNFGALLIIWDRLFGTFAEIRPGVPIRFGVTEPINTSNPLRVAVYEVVALARDIAAAPDWRSRVRLLF
jgi:sterol desaturase/sphingolipid hydroxylase (fatty acid hydroxylase superfamily)